MCALDASNGASFQAASTTSVTPADTAVSPTPSSKPAGSEVVKSASLQASVPSSEELDHHSDLSSRASQVSTTASSATFTSPRTSTTSVLPVSLSLVTNSSHATTSTDVSKALTSTTVPTASSATSTNSTRAAPAACRSFPEPGEHTSPCYRS